MDQVNGAMFPLILSLIVGASTFFWILTPAGKITVLCFNSNKTVLNIFHTLFPGYFLLLAAIYMCSCVCLLAKYFMEHRTNITET